MATDFFVYHRGDPPGEPVTNYEPEIQTLIPFLDAEDGGAATVTEVDPFTEAINPDHIGIANWPCIVAERGGLYLTTFNPTSAASLDPVTLVTTPGAPLASDTLDALETAAIAAAAEEAEEVTENLKGQGQLRSCLNALETGDLLTPDAERLCFDNLLREALGDPLVDSIRFVAETESDEFANDQGITDEGTGGETGSDDISWPDMTERFEGFVRRAGERSFEIHKSNLTATTAPTATDDETAGYALNSFWIDGTGPTAYICLDPSTGAAIWQALGTPGGGEANLGANVGSSGAEVFRDKTGVTLNFRELTTPGDHLSAVVNGDDIELDIGADLILDDIPDVEITSPQSGQVLTLFECPAGVYTWKNMQVGGSGGSGGFVVDAENIGSGGVGVFKTKNGSTLQFKKINAGSAKITITDDVGNDEVDIDLGVVSIDDLSDVDTTTDAPMTGDPLVWDGSEWVPESAFPGASVRDRQFAQATDAPTETSISFVDMPGMTVTTNNASALDYSVTLSLEVEVTGANRTLDFQVLVDGVASAESFRSIQVPGSSSPRPVSLTFVASAVATGKIIKAQWRTDGGTMTARARTILADGEL